MSGYSLNALAEAIWAARDRAVELARLVDSFSDDEMDEWATRMLMRRAADLALRICHLAERLLRADGEWDRGDRVFLAVCDRILVRAAHALGDLQPGDEDPDPFEAGELDLATLLAELEGGDA